MDDIDPENRERPPDEEGDDSPGAEHQDIAARATAIFPAPVGIEHCPHAALALAMASTAGATWGSESHALPIVRRLYHGAT